MKPFAIITVVLLALLVGGWLATKKSAQKPAESDQSMAQTLPAVTLESASGQPVELSSLKGKPLVVNSWATWCPFCTKELTDFAAVQQEFGDRVSIIAIDRAESKQDTRAFTDKIGLTDNLTFLLDAKDSFYQAIGGFSMPETLFVDKNGTIVTHKRGPLTREEMRQAIQQLVKGG